MSELLKLKRIISMIRGFIALKVATATDEIGKYQGFVVLSKLSHMLADVQDQIILDLQDQGRPYWRVMKYRDQYVADAMGTDVTWGHNLYSDVALVKMAQSDLRQHRNIAAHMIKHHGAMDPYELPERMPDWIMN